MSSSEDGSGGRECVGDGGDDEVREGIEREVGMEGSEREDGDGSGKGGESGEADGECNEDDGSGGGSG